MKSIQSKSTTNTNLYDKPFFQKESNNSFFSKQNNTQPFFSSKPIQTKLTVGKPGDIYEKEADVMADKVVQRLCRPRNEVISKNGNTVQTKPVASLTTMTPLVQTKCATYEQQEQSQKEAKEDKTDLLKGKLQKKPIFESNAEPPDDEKNIQRKCAACENEEKKLQTKSENNSNQTASSSIESSLSASKGSGYSLPEHTRVQMEISFGANFSGVRVHTGSAAIQMNKDLNAQAFAHGSDIYFNSGKYDTSSNSGKHLLAHESHYVY